MTDSNPRDIEVTFKMFAEGYLPKVGERISITGINATDHITLTEVVSVDHAREFVILRAISTGLGSDSKF